MAYVGRFADRAEIYAKHRPRYPDGLLDLLAEHGLREGIQVADMGSGTGLLSARLLESGATVIAVEPDAAMALEAQSWLGGNPGYIGVERNAEDTGLDDASIDLITAAQSFHWFDVEAVHREWRRILKPNKWVALIWNERLDKSEFSQGYRALAHAFVDASGRPHQRLFDPARRKDQLFDGPYQTIEILHHQDHDLEGLKGRALSSSYWPNEGPMFEASMRALEALFTTHAIEGKVRFDYVCQVFVGQLT